MKRIIVLMGLVAVAMMVADAQAFSIQASADAEVREAYPNNNYGGGNEIASRVDYGRDELEQPVGYQRNSVVYLKFDVSSLTAADLAGDIGVKMTYNNKNMVKSRFEDSQGGDNTGLQFFVMDNSVAGANWDESTIAPTTAPGIVQAPAYAYDGDTSTKPTGTWDNPTAGLTYLGSKLFDSAAAVGSNPHLPVGGTFLFTLGAGSALHTAIAAAQGTANETVTIVWGVIHDHTVEAVNPGWVGFNYVFNPKEKTTLNADADSPYSAADNSDGSFAPHLVPEPATMALLGLGGLLLSRKRK